MNKLRTLLKLMGVLLCFSIKTLDAGGSFIDSILNEEERQTARKLSSGEIDSGQFIRLTFVAIEDGSDRVISRLKSLAATGDAGWQLDLAKELFKRNEKQTACLVFDEILRTMPSSFADFRPFVAFRQQLLRSGANRMDLLEEALRNLSLS